MKNFIKIKTVGNQTYYIPINNILVIHKESMKLHTVDGTNLTLTPESLEEIIGEEK